MRGLYIHVPFCIRKCDYCDFYSLPSRLDYLESYVRAVVYEATGYAGLSFQTLYLGGGTPSLLGANYLNELISGLKDSFDFSQLVEATIEVNPESTTLELLETAKNAGINRISIGIQSLTDSELKSVGRIHDASQAIQAVKRVKKLSFRSTSADLIIGLPGQTWQTFRRALEVLITLEVEHLSLYCLSIEEGTPLAKNLPGDLPSDDRQAEIFEKVRGFLGSQGFDHYEISNFAINGHQCQHNLNYWRGGEYLGLGPAAASHLDGKRFKNLADLEAYLENPNSLIVDIEELNAREKAAEEAMLRLRLLLEGVNVDSLIARFGHSNVDSLIERLDGMIADGLLESNGKDYRLSPSRVLTSNPIFAKVLSP